MRDELDPVVAEMNGKRYTAWQVLCGVRDIWRNRFGDDRDLDFETRIDSFMKADGSWEIIDFAWVFEWIESFFGFTCSRREWVDFFSFEIAQRDLAQWEEFIAPRLTFGSLAKFIADRAPAAASFESISVLGRNCASAGAFTGIQQVVDFASRSPRKFAPSTPITDVLHGDDLERFWSQLRWMTEHCLPELPDWWRRIHISAVFAEIRILLGGTVATIATSNPLWLVTAAFISGACGLTAWAYRRFSNPIPFRLATFRDLSMHIAKSRSVFGLA